MDTKAKSVGEKVLIFDHGSCIFDVSLFTINEGSAVNTHLREDSDN
uniref:Uncharacterized protein n=1 Tax=Physcomitrium patens TaxID=3218 RepID=A0A7I3ZU01_PHYPA